MSNFEVPVGAIKEEPKILAQLKDEIGKIVDKADAENPGYSPEKRLGLVRTMIEEARLKRGERKEIQELFDARAVEIWLQDVARVRDKEEAPNPGYKPRMRLEFVKTLFMEFPFYDDANREAVHRAIIDREIELESLEAQGKG
ncbi:hypothetical protein K8R42_01700 [bacterium]|nr:hypothetical protein [bacterium]